MQIKANCPMIGLLSSLTAILLIAVKLAIPCFIVSYVCELSLSYAVRILIILTLIASCIPTKTNNRTIIIEK